jgi:hypothetical protein
MNRLISHNGAANPEWRGTQKRREINFLTTTGGTPACGIIVLVLFLGLD